MKMYILLAAVFLLTVSAENCNDKKQSSKVYKGKLEIKALCMNYTIKLLEGNIDTSKISGNWTNEATGKAYTNVFALGSPCTFPATINEGDEFYFSIDDNPNKECAVCMAYYPKPPKALSIKIVQK